MSKEISKFSFGSEDVASKEQEDALVKRMAAWLKSICEETGIQPEDIKVEFVKEEPTDNG